MKTKNKISIIIVTQILIIIASFLALVYFEQERTLLGNTINVAGKNRLLTVTSNSELKDILTSNLTAEEYQSINNLEKNIYFLKYGGNDNGLSLKPINPIFENDIELLEKKFLDYKTLALNVISTTSPSSEYKVSLIEFDTKTDELLFVSNEITNKLSSYDKELSELMLFLELLLLVLNIGLHIFVALMIVAILKFDSMQLLKAEKLSMIGELSARISHDLRNPLSVIKMAINAIQKNEQLNPQSMENVKIIQKSISRMNHQINDVMNYVKTTPLQLTKNKISEIIGDALIYSNVPKTVTVECHKANTEILCDKEKIFIVLINLIKNAIEAMEEKGKLIIEIKTLPTVTEVVVENTGPSIPTDELNSIFEPLFTTRNQGTGLGLATCKNIISEHKGKIFAKNNPTRFIISLPNEN